MKEKVVKITFQDIAIAVVTLISVAGYTIILGVGSLGINFSDAKSLGENWGWFSESWGIIINTLLWVTGIIFVKKTISNEPMSLSDSSEAVYNWQRTRQNFINNVRRTWVDGFLKHAIHQEVYHILGLVYKRDAVERAWNLHLIPKNELVPAEKTILEIFEQNGRSLLILGEPASGKTITLLQLAEELLMKAEEDEQAPVPIIFNLSSWTQRCKLLVDWMAEECLRQYGLTWPLTQEWIQKQRFIYLLDGLDEVIEEQQLTCLEAINQFIAQHPAEVVVCSRKKDYEKLRIKLNVTNALYIQPLNSTQIERYLQEFGERTAGVREMLQEDIEFQELAQSPLLLNLMVMAYDGQGSQLKLHTREQKLNCLFNNYVARMFQHRPIKNKIYTNAQALHWIINIAYGLHKTHQFIFYIESLSPSWLPASVVKTNNDELRIKLIVGLIYGLASGLIYGLFFFLMVGLSLDFWQGFVYGLMFRSIHLAFHFILLRYFALSFFRQKINNFFRCYDKTSVVKAGWNWLGVYSSLFARVFCVSLSRF